MKQTLKKNGLLAALAAAAVAVFALFSSLYTVSEREQAVVMRLRTLLRVEETPGLHFKLPLIDSTRYVDTRLQTFNLDGRKFRTADGKPLVVDVLVKWRVADAYQYSARESNVRSLVEQAVDSRLGDEFGKPAAKGILGGEWQRITDAVTASVNDEARKVGVEVVDVRVQRVGLPNNQSVYDRMKTERAGVATAHRGAGTKVVEDIRNHADREGQRLKAEGYAKGERIRGEGDARVAAIYAAAAAPAPEFFLFYRSLNAYKESFGKKEDVLVIDPSSDFFKYMKKPSR